jgi:hypothetical protein
MHRLIHFYMNIIDLITVGITFIAFLTHLTG